MPTTYVLVEIQSQTGVDVHELFDAFGGLNPDHIQITASKEIRQFKVIDVETPNGRDTNPYIAF